MNGSPSTSARFAGACGRKSARSANSTAAAQHATTQYPDQTPMPGSRQASQSLTFSGHVPYRGLFPSPPLFDRMPTYRTQGKRSLNFLSAGNNTDGLARQSRGSPSGPWEVSSGIAGRFGHRGKHLTLWDDLVRIRGRYRGERPLSDRSLDREGTGL